MRILLTAMDDALADAWTRHCGDLDGVHVHRGSIFDVACDALVSPANSFGFMDGGIDLAYSERFGWGVQDRLQAAIREHHGGELLVGDAEIVATEDPAFPWLIAAPTMRVPMVLHDSPHPYLAARAVMRLALHGTFRSGPHAGAPVAERVGTIAFPGLGTGVGGVPPAVCAAQVAAALVACRTSPPPFPRTLDEAWRNHHRLVGAP